MVGARGFEPRTFCAQGRRATRLRYAPTDHIHIILLRSASFLPALPVVLDNSHQALYDRLAYAFVAERNDFAISSTFTLVLAMPAKNLQGLGQTRSQTDLQGPR